MVAYLAVDSNFLLKSAGFAVNSQFNHLEVCLRDTLIAAQMQTSQTFAARKCLAQVPKHVLRQV
jgi:hypothetical protein